MSFQKEVSKGQTSYIMLIGNQMVRLVLSFLEFEDFLSFCNISAKYSAFLTDKYVRLSNSA
jgi:hypothetical protein